jgi:hypothetical protein
MILGSIVIETVVNESWNGPEAAWFSARSMWTFFLSLSLPVGLPFKGLRTREKKM